MVATTVISKAWYGARSTAWRKKRSTSVANSSGLEQGFEGRAWVTTLLIIISIFLSFCDTFFLLIYS